MPCSTYSRAQRSGCQECAALSTCTRACAIPLWDALQWHAPAQHDWLFMAIYRL